MRVATVTVVATPCHATQTPGQNISLILNHPVFSKLDFMNLIAIRFITTTYMSQTKKLLLPYMVIKMISIFYIAQAEIFEKSIDLEISGLVSK